MNFGLFVLGFFIIIGCILEWPWTKSRWFKWLKFKRKDSHSQVKRKLECPGVKRKLECPGVKRKLECPGVLLNGLFPEQMIATPNGMVPINNLKVGDQVFTLTGQTAFVSKVSLNPHGVPGLWFEKSIIPTIKL